MSPISGSSTPTRYIIDDECKLDEQSKVVKRHKESDFFLGKIKDLVLEIFGFQKYEIGIEREEIVNGKTKYTFYPLDLASFNNSNSLLGITTSLIINPNLRPDLYSNPENPINKGVSILKLNLGVTKLTPEEERYLRALVDYFDINDLNNAFANKGNYTKDNLLNTFLEIGKKIEEKTIPRTIPGLAKLLTFQSPKVYDSTIQTKNDDKYLTIFDNSKNKLTEIRLNRDL